MRVTGSRKWEFGLCECLGVGQDIAVSGSDVRQITKRTRAAAIGGVSMQWPRATLEYQQLACHFGRRLIAQDVEKLLTNTCDSPFLDYAVLA
eukprot:SAG31_NODE_3_length_45830_cov_42.279701_41_plen_92_part_00